MQVFLGSFHVRILATCSRLRNLQSWPLCAKFGHSLTEQNPSFQNWPKKWSLVHGTWLEGHPSTILMSWIQQSQRFIDLSNGHDFVARWIPPPTGFQGHLLNPYSGHRMEIVHQKGLSVVHACLLGMYYVGTLATPSRLSNMWIWPLCAKISHSLTKQNPSFQNWPK